MIINEHALFEITSCKQMSKKYAPCFNRIDFIVIPSRKELSCLHIVILSEMITVSIKNTLLQ